MKTVLLIAVPGAVVFTLLAWSLSRLSPDAIAMAIGMTLGVLSLVPTMVLVSMASRRDDEDDDAPYIDVQPTVYADQVTPYTHLARRAMQLPELPDRRTQIDQLRAVLDYIEAQEVSR